MRDFKATKGFSGPISFSTTFIDRSQATNKIITKELYVDQYYFDPKTGIMVTNRYVSDNQANCKTYDLQLIDDQEIKSHKIRISNTVTITYIYKEVTEGTAEKPVTPVTPTSAKKLRLPKGNNGVKTRVPAKKNTPILVVDYL